MIAVILSVVYFVVNLFLASGKCLRYTFKKYAYKFYAVEALSPDFKEIFSQELVASALPYKKLIKSEELLEYQGQDNRPIIYAAGELYINEEICQKLPSDVFIAGLYYEKTYYDTGFFYYVWAMVALTLIAYMPLFYILHYVANFLYFYLPFPDRLINIGYFLWPTLHSGYALLSVYLIEIKVANMLVNCYASHGHDLKSLLRYLQYVEGYVTSGVNKAFNITSNREECEQLLAEQESE